MKALGPGDGLPSPGEEEALSPQGWMSGPRLAGDTRRGAHPSPGTSRSLRPRARSCPARPPLWPGAGPEGEWRGRRPFLALAAGRALAACLRDIPAEPAAAATPAGSRDSDTGTGSRDHGPGTGSRERRGGAWRRRKGRGHRGGAEDGEGAEKAKGRMTQPSVGSGERLGKLRKSQITNVVPKAAGLRLIGLCC